MQQTIAQEIIDLLSLSSPSASRVGFSRITWNMMERCFCYMPAVASIHCHTCDQDFPFRLELLGEPADVAEVYRIPGLQYASTLQNGTGIVVSRGEIIGRMRSGTPACSCKLLVDVELWSLAHSRVNILMCISSWLTKLRFNPVMCYSAAWFFRSCCLGLRQEWWMGGLVDSSTIHWPNCTKDCKVK